jgi:nicotinate-nucleotide pyrophosphorylase (carboxylating)
MNRSEHPDLLALIDFALREDIGHGDITTRAIYLGGETATGTVIAKKEGVIAGVEVARVVARRVDSTLEFRNFARDGEIVSDGQNILVIEGSASSILTAERTILNFMQRMSGIATATRFYVDAVEGTGTTILDTRKTTPGNRFTDKWAVKLGGADNHRMRLDDMFLIKENHISVAGGISEALKRCSEYRKKFSPHCQIEIEVRNLDELVEALETKLCDIILLDNMSDDTMREAVILTAGRAKLEASGNMTIDRVTAVAATGVDFISVGALTHSVKALDLSMIFQQ